MNAIQTLTRLFTALMSAAVLALTLSACAAPENANSTGNTANTETRTTTTTTTTTAPSNTATTNAAPTNSAPTNAAAPAPTTTAAADDKIGVAECDDYLVKYESCLNDKVPAVFRAAQRTSFEQTRKTWRAAALTPEGRAGLAQACKTAQDSARQAMARYGCTF